MAVRGRGQIGLTDITDAYSANISTEAFTFQGDNATPTAVKSTQSFTLVVSGLCGTKSVNAAVDTTALTLPTGLTVSSDNDSIAPTLTFTATTSLTTTTLSAVGCVVVLPVSLDNNRVTLNKAVALSIAATGATPSSPYSITCGNEVQAISCDKDGKVNGAQTIVIPFSVFQGTSRLACTTTYSTLPDGITLATNGNVPGTTSAEGSLTFNVANSSTLGGTSNGVITLTIKVGTTTIGTKNFIWTKQIVGASGTNGTNGNNTATVQLYQRAASSPTKPSGTLTYTFATGVLSGTLGAWDQTVPDGTAQLWVITATAISNEATDTIAASEWTGPVKLVKDGTSGTNGYNQATIYLYQRNASSPSKPSSAVTYTFSTGALSSTPTGWSRTVPAANGNPCWVTSVSVVGQDATASIAANSWADVTKLVEDGEDGEDPYLIVIIPSNGTVFKNGSGTNTLTAHVYVGGDEITGSALAALGTIKWYQGNTYLTGKDGTTLTVYASQSAGSPYVTNSETFEARLES